MESNHYSFILGRKNVVVCALVGGANTTPHSFMNFISAYFAKRNLNGDSEFLKFKTPSPKPARIPPQTPPAGGTEAEAGRIHIPSQLFRPAESILILLEKSSRKVYNYSTSKVPEKGLFRGT